MTYFRPESELNVRAHTRWSRSSKKRSALMPLGVEDVLARFVEVDFEACESAHHPVPRRLVHAALDVDARVYPGHETRGGSVMHRRCALCDGRPVELRISIQGW